MRILAFCLSVMLLASCSSLSGRYDALLNPRESAKAFAAVARQVSPAVVSVQSEFPVDPASFQISPEEEAFLKRYFGEVPKVPKNLRLEDLVDVAQGSGFVFQVLDGRTYILTTNHLVANAQRIRVKLLNGEEFDAKVKGRDIHTDIAVLEIPEVAVRPLRLGDAAALEVGEWVLAIGNPFGLQHTLTVGVVSAKGRTDLGINDYEDFIQTDAAINPGNSGGPLVNLDGAVVGMNTAIFSSSGGYMGIGFAIPINFARGAAEQLIRQGEVVRGQLGVALAVLTREMAVRLRVPVGQGGVLVTSVQENSPADLAGFQVNDVIVAYAGQPVSDVGELRNRIAATLPGSRLPIDILRQGEPQTLLVDIGRLP